MKMNKNKHRSKQNVDNNQNLCSNENEEFSKSQRLFYGKMQQKKKKHITVKIRDNLKQFHKVLKQNNIWRVFRVWQSRIRNKYGINFE